MKYAELERTIENQARKSSLYRDDYFALIPSLKGSGSWPPSNAFKRTHYPLTVKVEQE